MRKFTLGVISGASALVIAVPLIAQVAGAATGSSSSNTGKTFTRPAPSVACVQALAAKDDAYLASIDAQILKQKTATTTHRDALKSAALITDDTQRAAAVKAADDAYHTALKPSTTTDDTVMKAVQTACGKSMGFGMDGKAPMGQFMGKGRMQGHGMKGNMKSVSSSSTK